METNYDALIRCSAEELFHRMEQKVSTKEIDRLRAAFEFAREAHSPQRRKSGEPYIIHPVCVARIVAEELELGADPVIAAFLHDVVEDTHYTIEDIRERFGDDVAFLVGVVTKEKKDKYVQSKQVDNYRQILASMQYDVRALLIKLADRLHNMRTLSSMRPDKQMKIAGETDYFYAPLANRLGLYHVKTELENLSFKYRCPREFALLEKLLAEEFEQKDRHIRHFTSRIERLLEEGGIKARTEVRYRRPYSIWMKMHSKGCDFAHVDTKYYVRVIYQPLESWSEKDTSLRIYSILTDAFKERPGSVSNYIDAPKENGYQSFQVKLLNDQGKWEELHISSERMVRNGRLGCAAERTDDNIQSWLNKFNELLKEVADRDEGLDFMDDVTSSFYYDDIMVFTPKGRGIILPKGATALDFAFEIHSRIGEHAHYARINGKLSSVKTVLKRGDCVEIGTNEETEPQADWLTHVSTYKARKFITTYLARQGKSDFIRCPHCHPLPGDEVIGFKKQDGSIEVHKRNCQTAIRLASQDGDSIVAVNFDDDTNRLYPVRISVRAIDRYHLLSDLVECITEKLHLSMRGLRTETADNIGVCTIDFAVHSMGELQTAMESIGAIPGVDEVQRIDVE
ncbi:MAG: bifunctional (p)ppGpp synthetase/guanosine-3',5'-bis(diphosphate) 3'-pyrophosphohydrolase [Bacteroidales bacterium]|nr:bifunctional (p)ppGpp synthetase/guanosine-3',5'-bis(diphosphate) 3'-pyrophosphohydrolase [Bacteroidales bacterium]